MRRQRSKMESGSGNICQRVQMPYHHFFDIKQQSPVIFDPCFIANNGQLNVAAAINDLAQIQMSIISEKMTPMQRQNKVANNKDFLTITGVRKLPPNLDSLPKVERFPSKKERWNTNEEILSLLLNFGQHEEWQTHDVVIRPCSGSILMYSRKKVRYRRDGYCWKKRKDGKTTREDHMKLKVQGVECIYGCYVHSAILPTFHRRCYWLLENPDIVIVHYLNVPYPDDGKITDTIPNIPFCPDSKEWTREELLLQLQPMYQYPTSREQVMNNMDAAGLRRLVGLENHIEAIVSHILEKQHYPQVTPTSCISSSIECARGTCRCVGSPGCTRPPRKFPTRRQQKRSVISGFAINGTSAPGISDVLLTPAPLPPPSMNYLSPMDTAVIDQHTFNGVGLNILNAEEKNIYGVVGVGANDVTYYTEGVMLQQQLPYQKQQAISICQIGAPQPQYGGQQTLQSYQQFKQQLEIPQTMEANYIDDYLAANAIDENYSIADNIAEDLSLLNNNNISPMSGEEVAEYLQAQENFYANSASSCQYAANLAPAQDQMNPARTEATQCCFLENDQLKLGDIVLLDANWNHVTQYQNDVDISELCNGQKMGPDMEQNMKRLLPRNGNSRSSSPISVRTPLLEDFDNEDTISQLSITDLIHVEDNALENIIEGIPDNDWNPMEHNMMLKPAELYSN